MIKYGKVLNANTGLCEVAGGTDIEFYKSIGMEEIDVELSDIDGLYYTIDKCKMKTQEEKEQELLLKLFVTPLDFIKMLQQVGLTTEQINNYIESNLEIKTQLTYCSNVYYAIVETFLPLQIGDITIDKDTIKQMFLTKLNL